MQFGFPGKYSVWECYLRRAVMDGQQLLRWMLKQRSYGESSRRFSTEMSKYFFFKMQILSLTSALSRVDWLYSQIPLHYKTPKRCTNYNIHILNVLHLQESKKIFSEGQENGNDLGVEIKLGEPQGCLGGNLVPRGLCSYVWGNTPLGWRPGLHGPLNLRCLQRMGPWNGLYCQQKDWLERINVSSAKGRQKKHCFYLYRLSEKECFLRIYTICQTSLDWPPMQSRNLWDEKIK